MSKNFETTSETTSEATSETTFKLFDVEINDDNFTFSLSDLLNSLLRVHNFTVIRLKSKSVKTRERRERDIKRQQEFENFTQRTVSQYEHVLTQTRSGSESKQQQKKQNQRARNRDRDFTRTRKDKQRDEQRDEQQNERSY